MAKRIGLISDATCDLPKEIIEQYDIGIIPVNVIFGENEVRQPFYDLQNEEFYRRINAGENAKSGIPAPKVIKDKLDEYFKKYDELIVITLSSKLSALNQAVNALVIKEKFENITVIDSLCGTIETGLVVLIAAREIAIGKNKEEIVNYIQKEIVPNVNLISYADTLKYLRRGGRISRLTHLMGRALNIKPIFYIKEGEIVSPGRVMLWQNIDTAFKKLMAKVAGNQTYDTIFVAHSGNPERCKEFIEYFKTLPNAPKEILMAEVGPAVGVHVGPNTIGFVWIGKYDEKWFKDI
ncbi:MAG: DegV family protein [Asgard group archaeon]|nr:DegV family protein [Asgard group archaeon]